MAQYYVSSVGANSGGGTTTAAPWLTLAYALANSTGGDTISLRGGDTFAESNSSTSGRTINSYGTGRATIAPTGNLDHALKFTNCGGVTVDNLILDGANNGTPTGVTDPDAFRPAGVEFLNTTGGTTKYTGITVTNCDISGFISGAWAYASGGTTSGYDQVTFNNNVIHDCTAFGIQTWASTATRAQRYTNVSISGNAVYNIPGYGTRTCGIGIVPGFCYGTGAGTDAGTVMVRDNLVYTLGASATNTGGGPGGIVAVFAEGATIQWNEVHTVKVGSSIDGIGVDFDFQCIGCVAQYNYVHACDGPGYLLYADDGSNTVRFNIAVDCGRVTSAGTGFRQSGTAAGNLVHNNTFLSIADTGGGACVNVEAACTGLKLYNNILTSNNGNRTLSVGTGATNVLVQGNNYDHMGEAVNIFWQGTSCASLAAFRTASSQENFGATARGFEVDSKFRNPTNPPATWGTTTTLTTFTDYQLQTASSLAGAGLDLSTLFAVTMPPKDFLGATLPASGYSLGAINAAADYGFGAATYAAAVLSTVKPLYFAKLNGSRVEQAAILGARFFGTGNGALAAQTGSLVNDVDSASLIYDGTNDYGYTTVNFNAAARIAVLMRLYFPSGVTTGRILEGPKANWTATVGGILLIADSASNLLCGFSGSGGLKYGTFPRPSTGAWHTIYFEFDPTLGAANEIKVYVDDVLQTFTYVVGGATDNTNTFPRLQLSFASTNNGVSNWLACRMEGLAFYAGTIPGSTQRSAIHTAATVLADPTAPVLSSPVGTTTGSTTATIGATTDEGNGTLYGVVTTSITQPSVVQIKAGQTDAGAAAPFGGTTTVTSIGAKTISATGLTGSTAYYAHLVHTDAAGNNSNRVTSVQFTTNAPPDVTPPTTSGWASPSAGMTITSTLSESGCVADGGGTSGAGGFTLTGTPATVSAWAISGTMLTLTLANKVYQGEVVTVAYARAGTMDDITDAAGNYLADFSATSVTNNSTQTSGVGGSFVGSAYVY